MTARDMHYDFKQKLNKIDSQKYRNLKVPEIDWKLNEAQEIFVKVIAQPRYGKQIGFEANGRTVNDIRTIVIDQKPSNAITAVPFGDNSSFTVPLPNDYWYLAKSYVIATKRNCSNIKLKTREVQHDDLHEESPFDKSSFEWRIANMRFNSAGIRVFTDGTFTINKMVMEYLKRPTLIHNAQDWVGGSYKTLDGVTLTGSQPCELPEGVHKEVVDLAVLITAGDLSLPDYVFKQNKLKLTQ